MVANTGTSSLPQSERSHSVLLKGNWSSGWNVHKHVTTCKQRVESLYELVCQVSLSRVVLTFSGTKHLVALGALLRQAPCICDAVFRRRVLLCFVLFICSLSIILCSEDNGWNLAVANSD